MGESAPQIERDQLFARFQALRQYVGCEEGDIARIQSVGRIVLPHLDSLIDDFYKMIQQHEHTRQRITGGNEQVERLKGTLATWLRELLSAEYDRDYVARRWLVGWRHVEIGLRQVYVNAAVSRLRSGILSVIHFHYDVDHDERFAAEAALNRALDLDLAIIQDAYEAEKHVRSEAAFRSLVESADCAILILRADHTIVYINPFAEKLTGRTSADVVGRNYLDTLIPPQEHEEVAKQIDQAMDNTPIVGHEKHVICRDGRERTLVWNARRLEDFSGGVAGLVVGHDVTELKSVQERALQAERLAAIGETMAGLAHESRNAFQRIQACLEMLQMEVEDRPEALELVQRIMRAQNHLHQLNEEVRSYAAPIVLDRQTCDVKSLWREVWHNLDVSRREKHVELREFPGSLSTDCLADVFALGQVIRNVFENAIAACPDEGGVVEVQLQEQGDGESNPLVTLTIRDNGPGFTGEAESRVFEPFFTTKTKGTGLGMAIVKRIVEAHHGKITAHTHSAGGAEVVITLPRE